MRKRPLMLIACVFLIGLTCQRFSVYELGIIVVFVIWKEYRIGRKTKNFKRMAGRSVLLLSAFFMGIFHMQREMEFREAYMSKMTDGCRITVWGECIKTETTEYGYRSFLSECYIRSEEETLPCNDVMVYTSKDHFKVGQIYKIEGKVKLFADARNEGNFDALVYYQSMKIDFAVEEESYVLLENNNSLWKRQLLSLREKVNSVYKTYMEEKAAGFYQAMVTGMKLDLDENLKDLFLIGGISHILAISGLHVSILGRNMYRILRQTGVGFGMSGFCSGVLLVLYCVMAGSSTSTVRAVGMMLFFFLAQWIGCSYDMLNALGGMVLLLLWENPFLMENSGFWFSVMALLGVGFVGALISKMMPSQKMDMSGIWMSLGITLTTLPVTALSYYEVPLYSPLVNFILLPLLAPVFGLAVIGGSLGTMFPNLGIVAIMLYPCEWLLSFYEWVCVCVSNLPGANLICGKPEWWQVGVYYVVLFGGVYLIQMTDKKRMSLMGGVVLCCGLCLFFPKAKAFEITFLDVGQGDAVYISAGDGSTYFIDGGSSNVNGVGEYRILSFLKAKGVASIDYWFVSHCDTDHMSGLMEIIEKGYKIEHIVLHEQCSSKESRVLITNLADKMGLKVIEMNAGDKVCSSQLEIQCLAPYEEDDSLTVQDENENSLVLQMECKSKKQGESFKALFAGDISSEMEKWLCKEGVLEDVDLFKANHHGSNYSNSSLFLETVCSEYIVVSCSKNNRYGHPGEDAVERMEECGAEIFYTMDGGQITFERDITIVEKMKEY